MQPLRTTYTMQSNQNARDSAHRRLRKLRILLIIWFVSLVATTIWFMLSA